jgi:hypothetical protein
VELAQDRVRWRSSDFVVVTRSDARTIELWVYNQLICVSRGGSSCSEHKCPVFEDPYSRLPQGISIHCVE